MLKIESINTSRSEFCPVIINNKLVFVAEKVTDIIDFEKSPTNNQPFLNVFASEIKNNEFTKSKLFSKNVIFLLTSWEFTLTFPPAALTSREIPRPNHPLTPWPKN
jgi:hypothetical protein